MLYQRATATTHTRDQVPLGATSNLAVDKIPTHPQAGTHAAIGPQSGRSGKRPVYGSLFPQFEWRYRPSAVLRRADLSGSSAACPVGRGHTLNSRSRTHSGRCGVDETAARAAGFKELLT